MGASVLRHAQSPELVRRVGVDYWCLDIGASPDPRRRTRRPRFAAFHLSNRGSLRFLCRFDLDRQPTVQQLLTVSSLWSTPVGSIATLGIEPNRAVLAAIRIRIRRGLFFRQPYSRVACRRVLVGNGNTDLRNVFDANTETPTVGRSSDGGDRIGSNLRSGSRTVRSITKPAVPELRAIRLVSIGNPDRQQRDCDQAGKAVESQEPEKLGSWGAGELGGW